MCITEYDEERTFAQQRAEGVEEGRIEGRKEGIKEGIIESVKKLIKKGKLSYDEIADNFEIPVEEVRRLAAGEVVVQRLGDSLILTPKDKLCESFLNGVDGFTEDYMSEGRYETSIVRDSIE